MGSRMDAAYRIVARTNGSGIDRDVDILSQVIAAAHGQSVLSHHREIGPWRRIIDLGPRDDCLIFLERVKTRWLGRADRFILIPNQERYAPRLVRLLRHVDRILVKTHHAHEIFSRLHDSVEYIGFTSQDRRLDDVQPDYSRFLHPAGSSSLKGTGALLEVWAEHPDWPTLTVLYLRPDNIGTVPDNVEILQDYLPDAQWRRIQNECGMHLCPSLSEGWGHAIVEGMSCSAVVLTTDGPPMNEIVGPDRGVLVPYGRSEPRKLGINFHVDQTQLEQAIERLLAMSTSEKEALGARARAWFDRNDHEFRTHLHNALSEFMAPQAP
jgi:glycosyltransferase involved in cell wall biosynthesis